MARPKIDLNHGEMSRLLAADQMRGPLREITARWAATARSTAPAVSGSYRDGIDTEITTAAALGIHFRRGGDDRLAGVVVAHAEHSAALESRTGNLKRAMAR